MPAATDAQNKYRTDNGSDTQILFVFRHKHTHTVLTISNTLTQIKGISVQW